MTEPVVAPEQVSLEKLAGWYSLSQSWENESSLRSQEPLELM